MAKIPFLKCGDCKRELSPTERRWEHHTNGGARIESFCEDCMLEQVNGYTERTIAGMLDGRVGVLVNGQLVNVRGVKVHGEPASEAERSEP
jgi:hypothetical protein